MSKNPRELYQSVIMRHNREPVGYEKHERAGLVIEAYNPLCGDQFTLYLEIEEERVTGAWFHGYGCAISKASTSVLIERIRGLALAEVRRLLDTFYAVVAEGDAPPAGADEELLAFAAARDFPARLKCATLSWDNLKKAIE